MDHGGLSKRSNPENEPFFILDILSFLRAVSCQAKSWTVCLGAELGCTPPSDPTQQQHLPHAQSLLSACPHSYVSSSASLHPAQSIGPPLPPLPPLPPPPPPPPPPPLQCTLGQYRGPGNLSVLHRIFFPKQLHMKIFIITNIHPFKLLVWFLISDHPQDWS